MTDKTDIKTEIDDGAQWYFMTLLVIAGAFYVIEAKDNTIRRLQAQVVACESVVIDPNWETPGD